MNEKAYGERDIPIIFLTAKDGGGGEIGGLMPGTADYIAKPFSVPLLLQSVEPHIALIVQKS